MTIDIRPDWLPLVIQAAMGWEDYPLHEFMAGETRRGAHNPDLGTDALPVTKVTQDPAM